MHWFDRHPNERVFLRLVWTRKISSSVTSRIVRCLDASRRFINHTRNGRENIHIFIFHLNVIRFKWIHVSSAAHKPQRVSWTTRNWSGRRVFGIETRPIGILGRCEEELDSTPGWITPNILPSFIESSFEICRGKKTTANERECERFTQRRIQMETQRKIECNPFILTASHLHTLTKHLTAISVSTESYVLHNVHASARSSRENYYGCAHTRNRREIGSFHSAWAMCLRGCGCVCVCV